MDEYPLVYFLFFVLYYAECVRRVLFHLFDWYGIEVFHLDQFSAGFIGSDNFLVRKRLACFEYRAFDGIRIYVNGISVEESVSVMFRSFE